MALDCSPYLMVLTFPTSSPSNYTLTVQNLTSGASVHEKTYSTATTSAVTYMQHGVATTNGNENGVLTVRYVLVRDNL